MDVWVVEDNDIDGTYRIAICDTVATAEEILERLIAQRSSAKNRLTITQEEVVTHDSGRIRELLDQY